VGEIVPQQARWTEAGVTTLSAAEAAAVRRALQVIVVCQADRVPAAASVAAVEVVAVAAVVAVAGNLMFLIP
jgi:hypothetical protein